MPTFFWRENKELMDVHCPETDMIILMMDHHNRHKFIILFKAFSPEFPPKNPVGWVRELVD